MRWWSEARAPIVGRPPGEGALEGYLAIREMVNFELSLGSLKIFRRSTLKGIWDVFYTFKRPQIGSFV